MNLAAAKSKNLSVDPKWVDGIGGIEAFAKGYALPAEHTKDGCLIIPVRFNRRERRMLRRKVEIFPSRWAERHRHLPRTARFNGLWRNSNVAYLAGIMDASFFKSVEEIIVVAAPQTGKTEAVYTCLGYAADRRPGNAMVLFPVETDTKDNAKDRIAPMFKDSPRLREYLTGYTDDLGTLKITLQHMIIYMAWSNSASRLSNRPVMYGHADEEEKYPRTAGKKEGSPVDLLKKRMRTFRGMRKLWRTSSPNIESGSIWQALTTEAQVVFDYYVRCPVCGMRQKMEFGDGSTRYGIKWHEDVRDPLVIEETRDVWYQCRHCDAKWDDGMRDAAVRDGEWRDREKGLSLFTALKSIKPLRIGFHIPAWLSPFVTMWECAAAFLRAQGDRTKLKDFLNGFAAEPWRVTEATRQEDRIMLLRDEHMPPGIVPGDGRTACLLAGIDTHGNDDTGRLDYEIRAFGYGHNPSTWGVRHGHLMSFDALKKVLWEDEYKDAAGNPYKVHFACIDAMGKRTAEVYEFCRMHRGLILPCQGKDRLNGPSHAFSNIEFYPGTKRPIPGGITLVRHDTNFFKNKLAGILEVNPGDPGCWAYHSELDIGWAREMCAEGINPETMLWENPNNRPNHAWDVSELLLLAAEIIGMKYWPKPEEKQAAVSVRAGGGPNTQQGGRGRPSWFRGR